MRERVTGEGWDFFVSYAHTDRAWAEWIAWQLEADGYRVLIQAWDMVPGSNWIHLMQEGVRQASRTVAVLSVAYVESVFTTAEWEATWRADPLGEQRKLLVFRVADCERPGLLAGVVSVNLFGVAEAAARTLVKSAARGAVTGRNKPSGEPEFPPPALAARSEPGFPGSLPEVWNVLPPVRTFIGRRKQVAELRRRLLRRRAAALVPVESVAALHGMGGIGKTQLVRAYAHRYRQDYRLGWWISAETEVTIITGLAELAVQLGLPAELPPARLAGEIRRALAGYAGKWLLVFDNAEQPQVLERFLPGAGNGHVVVTSRNPAWQGLADPLPVNLLPLGEAVRLLQARTGDRDKGAATALAEELGRLPLALEQAAAYASQYQVPLTRYLTQFRQRRAELLKRGRPLAYEGTVDTTFTLSISRLSQFDEAAVRLLRLCALLAPDEIPVRLLLSQAELLPDPLDDAARNPVRQDQMIGTLHQAGLVTADIADTLRVHRLVQAVTVAHLADAERRERIAQMATLLAALTAEMPWEPMTWPRYAQLLPHLQALFAHADLQQVATASLSLLLKRAGIYVRVRGFGLQLARQLDEQALAMDQRLHKGDHSAISTSLNNLAIDLRELGESARARQLHEQALAMDRRLHKGDHDSLALVLNNLAEDLRELGEFSQARELDEQALAMRQRLYEREGFIHGGIATSLDNLGTDLRELGELSRARELHEQALAMRQQLYGRDVDDPRIATSLDSLGADLRAAGDLAHARELHGQALAMRQRLYEADHLGIAQSLDNLASDLHELGEVTQARELGAEAAMMRQRLRGHYP